MAYDAAGQWVPGPNDHHIAGDKLMPGLGADEPSAATRRGVQARGEARMAALKEEIASATRELETKEQTLARREAELAAREARLAALERKAPPTPSSDESEEEGVDPDESESDDPRKA